MTQQKFRHCAWTLNNWTPEEAEAIKDSGMRDDRISYLVFGEEVGESGTPHLQGYCEFSGQVSLAGIKKMLGRRVAEIKPRYERSTNVQASDYCKKDGKYFEVGELKEQGKRIDLIEVRDKIANGTSLDELTLENPMLFHKYGRALSRVEDILLRKRFRTWMTTGTWYWGNSGVGKSHIALNEFDPDKMYKWTNDGGWWDGYIGQEIVIINEFRGQIPFSELLELIDKWAHYVKRRGREPVPFLAKHVIITSCDPPEEVYRNRLSKNDSVDQLLRRVEVIKMTRKYSEGNNGTSEQHRYRIPDPEISEGLAD